MFLITCSSEQFLFLKYSRLHGENFSCTMKRSVDGSCVPEQTTISILVMVILNVRKQGALIRHLHRVMHLVQMAQAAYILWGFLAGQKVQLIFCTKIHCSSSANSIINQVNGLLSSSFGTFNQKKMKNTAKKVVVLIYEVQKVFGLP